MQTKIISVLIGVMTLFTFSFASDLAGFIVNVDPSTAKAGEPTDLIVKAINANGDIIEDYVGDTIILVMDGDSELDINEYVVPNDGVYSFQESDMGTKVFTKGLIVNKKGDYKVTVEDFETGSSGKGDIKVLSESGETTGKVHITTPQESETIKNSTISIAGFADGYSNSKIQVLMDGEVKTEGMIDSSGNYQVDIVNVSNGDYDIKIEVLDFDENIVAESGTINVNVDAQKQLYKGITISPEKEVNKGTQIAINVKVDSSVTSATLDIANYGEYPMDRKSTDEFTTELKANILGKSDISLDLSAESGTKTYDNISEIVVVEKMAIQEVIFKRDNNENIIELDWEFTGEIPKFKVQYGTKSGEYNTEDIIVEENKYNLEDIDAIKTYFVKIIPVDSNGNTIGDASKEVVIEPNMKEAATCNIDNIRAQVVSQNNNYYLTWDEADDAVKYTIYKGEKKDDLDQIAELTGTKYQLPFNPNAEEDEYSYFAVKAVCDDGTMKQIDNIKKVKVGPIDWLLYAIFITLIVYGLKLSTRES